MIRKPNFFIIGAPKCGTTSLATWLSEHPQVYMTPEKEPDFFYPNGKTKTIEEYENLFTGVKDHHIAIGEASVRYLFGKDSVPKIIQYAGENTKLIVMLRNPVEMAYSLHAQRVYSLNENVRDFEKAWAIQGEGWTPRQGLPKHCYTPEINNYGSVCKLGDQIERLFKTIGRDQCKIIILDKLINEPLRTWESLMSFLEIDGCFFPDFKVMNKAKRYRCYFIQNLYKKFKLKNTNIFNELKKLYLLKSVLKWNIIEEPRKPLRKDIKLKLYEYFMTDIDKLETILEMSLSTWRSYESSSK